MFDRGESITLPHLRIYFTQGVYHIVTFEMSECFSATASTCNVVLMRNSELVEGIEVFDRNGRVIGTSKAAAKKVSIYIYVAQCLLSYLTA